MSNCHSIFIFISIKKYLSLTYIIHSFTCYKYANSCGGETQMSLMKNINSSWLIKSFSLEKKHTRCQMGWHHLFLRHNISLSARPVETSSRNKTWCIFTPFLMSGLNIMLVNAWTLLTLTNWNVYVIISVAMTFWQQLGSILLGPFFCIVKTMFLSQ